MALSEKPQIEELAGLHPDLPIAAPEEVGMSSERLARIRPAMQRVLDQGVIPGVINLVARKGKVVHMDALGFRDVETEAPAQTDSIYRIASMTKPITSVALMMLFEEGHFLLSDPIKKWIPKFSDPQVALPIPSGEMAGTPTKTVPAARDISILHLLTHTAGLANVYRGPNQRKVVEAGQLQNKDETAGDVIKRIARIPLNFHPGEAWEYSRATCVIGHLVEIISGMTLDDFFKKRIFKPLGMMDTHFYLPEEKLDRFTAAYTPGPDKKIKLTEAPNADSFYINETSKYYMGSGGLVSTLSDYYKFNQMMINFGESGGQRLLGRKTVEFMTKNHTGDLKLWLPGPWVGFGLGYAVARNTDKINGLTANQPGPVSWSEGSYTWGGAFCTYQWIDPVEKLTGIIMTQVRPYDHLSIRHSFVGLVNQAIID